MKQRGRPSSAALALAPVSRIEKCERQRTPHDLNDEETEVWVAVVNDHPADWFSPSTVPILTAYCRHVIQARRVGELIEKGTSDPALSIKDYDRLLHMQQRESLTIATLATKMRISQQSTTNHRGNKTVSSAPRKPWEG